ncbi:MAG: hypothetical protein AB9869_32345 [Verrucomicrobiia bacterium]
MAIVKLNSAIKEMRGSLGDMVFIPRGNGEAIARRKGRPPEVFSDKQKAHQTRFSDAAAYARSVQKDPALSEPYLASARAKGLSPYQMALGDFMKAPEVEGIDLSGFTGKAGGVVLTSATEWKVVEVQVRILTLEGAVQEEGAAALDADSGKWLYTARTSVPSGQTVIVEATVKDRPGNTAQKTAFWAERA